MESLCVRSLGRPAGPRLALVLSTIALITLLQPFTAISFAQDAMSNPAREDEVASDMNRGQWRARVAEAKHRSQQFALEHRGHPTFDSPSIADEERIASEQVLNDDSLQRGDIVSTNKGLFVFKGRSDQERRASDFVALRPR
jgi:hypothetical protein